MICTELLEYHAHHKHGTTTIKLIEYPDKKDWEEVRKRALITIDKRPIHPLSEDWLKSILRARHSPIRRAMYSFLFVDIPSNTATHFARHVHAQPYISTLREDRMHQDGDHAPRCTPVQMILDVNAEELMIMANKRLCGQASPITQHIMTGMCSLVNQVNPFMQEFLVPMCGYHGGICHEMFPCGRLRKEQEESINKETKENDHETD